MNLFRIAYFRAILYRQQQQQQQQQQQHVW